MARPRKNQNTEVQLKMETTQEQVIQETPAESNPAKVPVEQARQKTLICNSSSVRFRKKPTLDPRDAVREMPMGVEFSIAREVRSTIYGEFYQLTNGFYVEKHANYTIKE